ncbi:Uncharacterized protein dnm_075330 [Desulfonema magnum]|uniref:Uncharacterized protein n=1 Tax=Desulfonema magnum TaxID=45655 RepID=A0A975GRV3_9BACT|nr:Uncharacterized protein dnm_075330 [Desulfonema magnum]
MLTNNVLYKLKKNDFFFKLNLYKSFCSGYYGEKLFLGQRKLANCQNSADGSSPVPLKKRGSMSVGRTLSPFRGEREFSSLQLVNKKTKVHNENGIF